MSSTHRIHLWGALRPLAGGALSITMEADTIRALMNGLVEQYPGMEPHIRRGVAVSIAGRIYRDQWDTPLPCGAEIYLLPRLPGG